MKKIETLNQTLAPLIQNIRSHPLYRQIRTLEHVRIFMEHHVFAVWDFMCLLKELYRRLVTTQAPWLPPRDAYSARLINQILVDEEGDLSDNGVDYLSHFDLYVSAMRKIGADTQPVTAFLRKMASGQSVSTAMADLALPDAVQHFVNTTFSFFDQDTPRLAAAFVYGREAITTSLFTPILSQLAHCLTADEKESVCPLMYYLNRHIQLDDEAHFPRALQMLCQLTGDNAQQWQAVSAAATQALQARLYFLTRLQSTLKAAETTTQVHVSEN